MVKVFALLCLIFPAIVFAAGNERIDSWDVAKRHFDDIYEYHQVTLYCGFRYDPENHVALPARFPNCRNEQQCNMWREHVVAVENFGRAFPEWRIGSQFCVRQDGTPYRGRECAAKVSERFRLMYCDLHNVFPSVGCVNLRRGHREFQPLPAFADMPFGEKCPMKFMPGKAEPLDRAKGVVARAYRYMDWAYPEYNMSSKRRRIMEAWDEQFPPEDWECARNYLIKQVQGNGNPFIEKHCGEGGPELTASIAQEKKELEKLKNERKSASFFWGCALFSLFLLVFLCKEFFGKISERKRQERVDAEIRKGIEILAGLSDKPKDKRFK